MSSMATAAVPVRTAILAKLREKDYRAIDLLRVLGTEGYNDSDIKQALSDLLREDLIELTPDRMLRFAAEQDAA